MTDIVEWLRGDCDWRDGTKAALFAAADEIERLRAECSRLATQSAETEAKNAEIKRLRAALHDMTRLTELFAIKWDATQSAETEAKNAEIKRLRAALHEMVEISRRSSDAQLMLIAIRHCARHALEPK